MANLRELYLQAIEAYNAHNLDSFIEYYTADCDVTVPGFPPFRGKAAARECWRLFMESFPDDHLTVTNQVVEGATVVGEWTAEATNTGALICRLGTCCLQPASDSPARGSTSRSSKRDESSPIVCTGTRRRCWHSSA